MFCVSCKTAVPVSSKFCNSCGRSVTSAAEDLPTEVIELPQRSMPRIANSTSSFMLSSSSGEDEGRFLPGTLVAERYRISSLIGRGGMGEVYRATDLKLGQPVALKFLPEALSRDQKALQRFYNEVRVARQISHHNVCRVYDIGETEGLAYISMEFINGEDLGALLKRIGRLPTDKALQMARQLCAGLAAAHEKGVLHRDLKPANVMIDCDGALHVMDFGLAGLAEQVAGDVRSGTPAYMAPEQLAGREVTMKSDLYSLGLVLYEMFTGKKPYNAASLDELRQLQEQSSPDSLTTHVSDIDPSVERVIFRCLAAEPKERPASSLSIANALPGGDPLAAALAAGETPSPELVAAAAANSGLLPVSFAVACLALLPIALLTSAVLSDRITFVGASHIEHSPEYLAQTARDLLDRLGYTSKPMDHALGFAIDNDYVAYHSRKTDPDKRWNDVASLKPGPMFFWYRESPVNLQGTIFAFNRGIGPNDPQMRISGEVAIQMDVHGRLNALEAVPPQRDDSPPLQTTMSWDQMFDAAGLDKTRFQASEPQWLPLAGWDDRTAWKGTRTEDPGTEIRVEAAAWRGRPVYFDVIGPWTRPFRQQRLEQTPEQKVQQSLGIGMFVTMVIAGVFFVRSNIRAGRVDRKGAFRLGAYAFIVTSCALILYGHHQTGLDELFFFVRVFANSCFLGVVVWLIYLAVEPPVRKRWPQTMISWSRVLAGRWHDPLVASHILAGLGAGAVLVVIGGLTQYANMRFGGQPSAGYLGTLLGIRQELGGVAQCLVVAPSFAMISFFSLFLFRLIFRRDWLTAIAYILFFAALAWFGGGNHAILLTGSILSTVLFTVVLLRYGLLANMVMSFSSFLASEFPVTVDLGSWRGDLTLLVWLILIGMGIFSFRLALAHRKIFAAIEN